MQRFLPSLWLLAAALYATVALFLEHALYEKALMAQVAAHETVRAKQPARALDLSAGHAAPQRMGPGCELHDRRPRAPLVLFAGDLRLSDRAGTSRDRAASQALLGYRISAAATSDGSRRLRSCHGCEAIACVSRCRQSRKSWRPLSLYRRHSPSLLCRTSRRQRRSSRGKSRPIAARIASAYCRVGGYSSDGNACRGKI